MDPAEAAVREDRRPGRPVAARPRARRRSPPRSAGTRRPHLAGRSPRTRSASESRCALRHLAGQVSGRDVRPVGQGERPREVVLEDARAGGVRARLEDGHEPPASRPRPAQRAQASRPRPSGGARSRRRRVTPRDLAAHLEPPLDALERRERLARRPRRDAGLRRGRERGQRVPDVVRARPSAPRTRPRPDPGARAGSGTRRPGPHARRPASRPRPGARTSPPGSARGTGSPRAPGSRCPRPAARRAGSLAAAARRPSSPPRGRGRCRRGRTRRCRSRPSSAGSARTSAACRRTPSRTRRPRSRSARPRPSR